MTPRQRCILAYGALLLVTATAVGLFTLATRHGIGLVGDSADYVRLAAEMRGRQALVLEETHFPPLYPLLLAVSGHRPEVWRIVHGVLLAITVWSVGLLAWRTTRHVLLTAAVVGGFAFAPDTQLSFALLMSEALFVPLVIGAVALIDRRRPWRLVPAGALLGAAAVTRHAGLFFVAGLVATPLLCAHGRRRLAGLLVGALAAGVALVPWLAWRVAAADRGAEAARVIAWHPPTWTDGWKAVQTFGGWFLPLAPPGIRGLLGAALVALLVVLAVCHLRQGKRREGPIILMVLFYTAGLMVSRTLLDAATPLAGRLWLPVLPLVLVWLAMAARRWWRRRGWLRPLVACAALGLVGLNVHASLVQARHLCRDGIGYAAPSWAQSPTMAFVADLPPETPILSNAADAILLLKGREAQQLPMTRFLTANRVNTRWRRQLIDAALALRGQGGLIVYFHGVDREAYLVTEAQLHETLHVEPVAELTDGTVYRVVTVR